MTSYCAVRVADAVFPPELAPMMAVPVAWAVAKPATLGALATVATVAEDELQWLFSVMSWVVPSLNVPVAMNGCRLPTGTETVSGVIATATSVPVPTVKVVVPVTFEAVAEMVTLPLFLP